VPTGAESERAVARVDGEAITAAELDSALRLALYDLEYVRYEARLAKLQELVQERLRRAPGESAADRVEILLEPPDPPRIALELGDAPVRGAAAAEVVLVEFVDFESAHCRRMQPILRRLLEGYAGVLQLVVFDLPLPFHPHAKQAASAAGCAAEQGAYWAYHDALLQTARPLDRDELERQAGRLSLDEEPFALCLDRHTAAAVEADLGVAAALGLRVVPTFFVNGLYLRGPRSYEELARVIDRELGRPPAAERSAPPSAAGQSDPVDPSQSVSLDRLPDPDAVLTLSRAALDAALQDREALAGQLSPTLGKSGGPRVLQIREMRNGDLFALLGLESGDALLLVDGEWITDVSNPLWKVFAERDTVTLAILRRARRHVFRYEIE